MRRSVLQKRAVDAGFDEQLRQVTTRIKYPCLHGIAGDADGLGSLVDRLPMVVDEIDDLTMHWRKVLEALNKIKPFCFLWIARSRSSAASSIASQASSIKCSGRRRRVI